MHYVRQTRKKTGRMSGVGGNIPVRIDPWVHKRAVKLWSSLYCNPPRSFRIAFLRTFNDGICFLKLHFMITQKGGACAGLRALSLCLSRIDFHVMSIFVAPPKPIPVHCALTKVLTAPVRYMMHRRCERSKGRSAHGHNVCER